MDIHSHKSKANNLANCWLYDLAMSSLAILIAHPYNSWLYVWAATLIFSSHLSHSLSTFVGIRVAAGYKLAARFTSLLSLIHLTINMTWHFIQPAYVILLYLS